MTLKYDAIYSAFLSKITEYEFLQIPEANRTAILNDYLNRAVTAFRKNCRYDLTSAADDVIAEFRIDVSEDDAEELIEILSEGMVVQWLKPYLYKQELLENTLNTRDFSGYSPAELLLRVGSAYATVKKDYTQMIREYSYNHGDLTRLHI